MTTEEIETELAQHIESLPLRVRLAEAYVCEDRVEEALGLYDVVARRLYQLGRFNEFVQVAERLLYFDRDDHELRWLVVKRYLRDKDHRRALSHLQVLFGADSEGPRTIKAIARCFQELEHFEREAMVRQELGRVYRRKGETHLARREYERVLAINQSRA